MNEYFIPITLAMLLTLVYSCSDNQRQKKMDRNIDKTAERVHMAHATISANQNYLERHFKRLSDNNYAIGTEAYAEMVENQILLVENHSVLVKEADELVLTVYLMNQKKNSSSSIDEDDLYSLKAKLVDISKSSRKILKKHSRLNQKHSMRFEKESGLATIIVKTVK
jgi:Tfp pilus assembly protein PilE